MRRGRLGERNEGPYAAGPDDLPAALSTRDKKRGRAAAPLLFVVSRYPPSRGGTAGRPFSVCVCATDRLGRRDGRDAQSTGRPTGRPFFLRFRHTCVSHAGRFRCFPGDMAAISAEQHTRWQRSSISASTRSASAKRAWAFVLFPQRAADERETQRATNEFAPILREGRFGGHWSKRRQGESRAPTRWSRRSSGGSPPLRSAAGKSPFK
jgi:hypothetical protein